MGEFNWRNPDYAEVFQERADRLLTIRANPAMLPGLEAYYRDHIPQFIDDWGCTFDPRLVANGMPGLVPFKLFPAQRDWIEWFLERWRTSTPGIADKSRDTGMSWMAVATSLSMCRFFDGLVIGFGSRKSEYVDKLGNPKSILEKGRIFLRTLPVEFRGGWEARRDAPHMRIVIPATGSYITGEGGDNIGRGDRTGVYVVDEAAYLERPQLTEMSLSQTTNCRIDISSANGMANPFAEKRHSGKISVKTLDWTQDPRKDQAWYDKQCEELDPVTVAQEIDIDYAASVEGVLIPSAWISASIDAHIKLNMNLTGIRGASLDVADEGRDLNAMCISRGPLVERLEQWTGKGSDILGTVERAFGICDEVNCSELEYDADGLGAGVRGDARAINARRADAKRRPIIVVAFQGSEAVARPTDEDVPGRENADMFANRKAQAWWSLRRRFQLTHRAVTGGPVAAHDDLISLPSGLKHLSLLRSELGQPTYRHNEVGKTVINKTPDGVRSPNLADAVMIRFSGANARAMLVTADALARSRLVGRR